VVSGNGGAGIHNKLNADSFEILGAPPEIGGTYNEADGWTPDEYGYYFVVWLNQGQALTFDFSEIPSVIYCLYSSVAGDVEDELIIYSDTLIAQADGYYAIFVEESTATLQAYINNTRTDVLNGQTGSKLTLNEIGNFLCEVTFKNGATEISETVAMTHIHAGGTAICIAPAVCQVCCQSYGNINAEAHNWDNGTVTTTATCKVIGVKTYTCQHNSNHTYTENLEFNTSNHVNITTVPEIPATTDTVGYTEGVYCNDCNKYISGHNEIPVTVSLGDVDGDGEISASDARLALRASVGLEDLSDSEVKAADVDGDGSISSADARLILRASVGLEDLEKWIKSE